MEKYINVLRMDLKVIKEKTRCIRVCLSEDDNTCYEKELLKMNVDELSDKIHEMLEKC